MVFIHIFNKVCLLLLGYLYYLNREFMLWNIPDNLIKKKLLKEILNMIGD